MGALKTYQKIDKEKDNHAEKLQDFYCEIRASSVLGYM